MTTSDDRDLKAFELKLKPECCIIGCFSINEFYVSVSKLRNNTLFQYFLHSGEEIKSININVEALHCANCPFNNDLFALATTDYNIEFWNIQSRKRILVLEGHTKYIYSLVFSPHDMGRTLMSVSEDMITRLWDTNTGECINVLEFSRPLRDSSYAPNGETVVTCQQYGPAELWNPHTGKLLGALTNINCYSAVQYSPDGKYIATISSNELMLIDPNTNKVIKKLPSNNVKFCKLAFMRAPGVYVLLATSYNSILMWNLNSDCTHMIKIYSVYADIHIKSLTFSPKNDLFLVPFACPYGMSYVNAYRLPATMCSFESLLSMKLASRRQKLPYIPPELWELMFIEFM